MKQEKGSLQQRFRAEPLLGMQVLFGAFTFYALVADPVWHSIYGADLTAWSIPHVILILIWVMNMVLGIGMTFAALRERQWTPSLSISFDDIIPILLGASVLMMVLVMFAVEWELYTLYPSSDANVLRYPDWFFPLFVIFTANFVGILANMASRRVGVATLIGLSSIAMRLILVYSLDHITRSANPWLLALMPLIGIDLTFLLFLKWKGQPPTWYFSALGAMVVTILGLYPLLNSLYRFPNVGLENAASMSIALFLGALLASWMATKIGQSLSAKSDENQLSNARIYWLSPVAFLVLLALIALFIVTATPPMV